jgi:hypothetical protein
MMPDPAPAATRYRVAEADLAESDREDALDLFRNRLVLFVL